MSNITTTAGEQLISQLQWRYATKRMNGQKIEQGTLDRILEATQLSASSYGLQPYTILVIEDEATRKALQPVSWGQSQVVDSSCLLVYCVWDNITEANVDTYMQDIATKRGISVDMLADFKGYIMNAVNGLDQAGRRDWAARQAYIALGTTLVAAAAEEVDTTPMEGFVPAEVDKILGLEAKGLRSVVMCALGYRDAANDYLATAKKVRRDKDQLFQFI